MTPMELPLASVQLEQGTQVRAAIDPIVVQDYVDRMREGAIFPNIAVFFDAETSAYILCDGFHRVLAARHLGRSTITADVHVGTRTDALWFALGANRTNGQRLTAADKTNCVKVALDTYQTKTHREIAAHVGCSASLVSKVRQDIVKTTGGAADIRGRALANQTKRDAIRAMVLAGHESVEIKETLHAHSTVIAEIRRELGLTRVDYARASAKSRYDQIRTLATSGHTSRQIAAGLGISADHCRDIARKAGIEIPADAVTRGTHLHDSNRILARIVMDAENLSAGADLIDFRALDRAHFAEWIRSLRQARSTISTFIKRLTEESHHGEAA